MPTNANVAINVSLNTAGTQNLQQAQQVLQQLAATGANINLQMTGQNPFGAMTQGANRAADAWKQLGAVISTTAVVGAFKILTNEAIQFESAIANVAKVLDGGAEALANVKASIVELARVIPVSQKGLAEIAVAAGQMGIAGNDVAKFMETTAKASTAFGMTADETGQSFGNLTAVLKLNQDSLRLYADAINYVGNNSATNERKLIDFIERTAGTAVAAGASKEQLLALGGAALPAVGNSAERAATAVNALFSKLATAGSADQKTQDTLKTIGLNATDMAKKLRTDANGALTELRDKLVQFDGASQLNILGNIFGRESADEIANILANLDQATKLTQGLANATSYAGSVQKEFEVRAKTTEAQLQLFKNSMTEAAINIGGAFLPALNEAAKTLTALTTAIADFSKENPKLVEGVALAVGGLILFKGTAVALGLLLPGLAANIAAAGAAGAGAATGLGALAAVARGLLVTLGGLPVAIAAVLALLPKFLEYAERSNQAGRAIAGQSKNLADATAGFNAIQADIDRLNKTYENNKGSTVYQANLYRLTQQLDKARGSVQKMTEAQKVGAAIDADLQKKYARRPAEEEKPGLPTGTKTLPTATPKAPKAGGGGAGAAGAENQALMQEKQLAEARERTVQASEDAQLNILKAANQAAMAQLEASYSQRLLTTQAYEQKKLALALATADAEDKLLQDRVARDQARLEQLQAEGAKSKKAQVTVQLEIETISQRLTQSQAQLQINEQRRAELETRTAATLAQVEQRIQSARAQLNQQLLSLQGKELDAAKARINEDRRQFNMTDEGQDPTARALRDNIDAINGLKAELDSATKEYDAAQGRLQQRNAELRQQYEQGQLTSLEYARAQREANRELAKEMQQALDKMAELQDTLKKQGVNDPQLDNRLRGLRTSIKGLTTDVDDVAKSINKSLADGLVSGLEGLINRTQTLGDVLQNMLYGIAQTYQQIAAKNLNESIMRSLGNSSMGSPGSWLSGAMNFLTMADGGMVRGPGGPRSDVIPAMLSNGEAVLNADAVNYVGEDFVHWLNRRARRFADGGIANGRTSASAPFIAPQSGVNIYNQLQDDEIINVLDTPKGRRVVNNIIKASQ